MTKRREGTSIAIGAAIGASVVAALFAFPSVADTIDARSPVPPIASLVFTAAVVVFLAIVGFRLHDHRLTAFALPLIPLGIGTYVTRTLEPDPAWADSIRAFGLLLLLALALASILVLARRYRELERLVFTEATSVAFFITLIGAGVYGIAQGFFNAPELSFAWLPLFGIAAWGAAAVVFGRRYS